MMSFYDEKLVALLAIDCEAEQPHILIRLTFNEGIDIKWNIDRTTTEHLKALFTPNDNYKYRLSFQSMPIPTKDCHYSWVTKTHGETSENIFFTCSDDYVAGLESIKKCTSFEELALHPAFTLLSPIKQKEQKTYKKKGVLSNKKWVRLSVATFTVIAFVLLYSGHSYDYEPAFAKKVAAVNKATSQPTITHKQVSHKTPTPEKVVKTEPKQKSVPTFQIDKLIASYVPEGSVALTFDDGPSKHTKDIVNILKANHAGGTFFFIGQNVMKYPESVQYTHTNGFTIGNHTMHHPDLTKLSDQGQQAEISKTNQLIEKLISEPVTLFRPPYEAKNQSTVNLMQNDHLQMVLWDRDPRDWATHDPQKILNYIKNNQSSGTIILLHESQNVVDILPSIINYLKSQHLQLVTLKGDSDLSLE